MNDIGWSLGTLLQWNNIRGFQLLEKFKSKISIKMCRTVILYQKSCVLDVFTLYIFLLTFYKWNFKRLHYLPSWNSLDLNSKFHLFYVTILSQMRVRSNGFHKKRRLIRLILVSFQFDLVLSYVSQAAIILTFFIHLFILSIYCVFTLCQTWLYKVK